jgi:hypothetical protein
VPCVLHADVFSPEVINQLKECKPHLTSIALPLRTEESDVKRSADLMVSAQLPVVLVHCSISTLASPAWTQANAKLHAHCFDAFTVVLNGRQCGAASSRTRALVAIHKATIEARSTSCHTGVLLCVLLANVGQGKSVKQVLGCTEDTYYLRPSGPHKNVWSIDKPLRSVTNKSWGKPPSSAVEHPDHKGPLSEARILSLQEVASLLPRQLPTAGKHLRRKWLTHPKVCLCQQWEDLCYAH